MTGLTEASLQASRTLTREAQEKVDSLREEIRDHQRRISSWEDDISEAEEAIEEIERDIEEATLGGVVDPTLGDRLDGILHIADWAEADDLPLYDRRDVDRLVAKLSHDLRDSHTHVAQAVRAAHHAVWLGLPTWEVVEEITVAKREWSYDQRVNR